MYILSLNPKVQNLAMSFIQAKRQGLDKLASRVGEQLELALNRPEEISYQKKMELQEQNPISNEYVANLVHK